jgi:hypothetical protein
MDRSNHYEVAFESYLLAQRLCYVAVDETRRSLLDDAPLKSLDFLVFSKSGARLVLDIKGRRFPSGPPRRPRRVWECWSFREDLDALDRWASMAGPDYRGLLVFAYYLQPSVELPPSTPDLHLCRGKRYLFRAVEVTAYREHMRRRSPSWETVTLSKADFRVLVRPFCDFVHLDVAEKVPF